MAYRRTEGRTAQRGFLAVFLVLSLATAQEEVPYGLEPTTTWQDVVEVGRTIKSETDLEPISMYYDVNAGHNLFLWLSHLWGNGGDIFDANYRPVFNNEAGVEATEAFVAARDGADLPAVARHPAALRRGDHHGRGQVMPSLRLDLDYAGKRH